MKKSIFSKHNSINNILNIIYIFVFGIIVFYFYKKIYNSNKEGFKIKKFGKQITDTLMKPINGIIKYINDIKNLFLALGAAAMFFQMMFLFMLFFCLYVVYLLIRGGILFIINVFTFLSG